MDRMVVVTGTFSHRRAVLGHVPRVTLARRRRCVGRGRQKDAYVERSGVFPGRRLTMAGMSFTLLLFVGVGITLIVGVLVAVALALGARTSVHDIEGQDRDPEH